MGADREEGRLMRQRKAYPNAYREKPTRSMRGCPVLGRWSLERLDFTFLNGRLQWILEALEAAMQFEPGLLIGVLLRHEAGDDPAMFRDQDRLTRIVHLINQRQAFCFKLGCGDLHMTSMDDQSLNCQSACLAKSQSQVVSHKVLVVPFQPAANGRRQRLPRVCVLPTIQR